MVDIVIGTDAVGKAVKVVYRRENIIGDDMARNKIVNVVGNRFLKLLTLILLHKLLQNDKADALFNAQLSRVKVNKVSKLDHAVGENLYLTAVSLKVYLNNAVVVDLLGDCAGDKLTGVCDYLTCYVAYDRSCEDVTDNSGPQCELFVVFITSDSGDVVSSGIKEEVVNKCLGAVDSRGITGTQTAAKLDKSFLSVAAGVLFKGGINALIVTKDLFKLFIGNSSAFSAGHGEP